MGRSRTSAKAEVVSFCRTFGSRRTKRFAGLLIAAAIAAAAVPAVDAVSSERLTSARRAAQWIVDRQQSNGAFFSATQRVDQTAETLVAVVAGGITGAPVVNALSYVRANGQAGATRAAFTGRIVAGIVAGGGDPRSFGGVDYVAILNSQYDQATGAFEPGDFDFFSNVIAANGAVAGTGSLPPQAVAYLRSNECAGGGFSFSKACAFGADLDTTALTVNVFVAAGLSADPVVVRGRTFALTRQDADGGFTFDGSSSTSGDSTGLGLALIAALGEEAQVHPWRQADGDDPVIALLALQDADGAFRFSSGDAAGNALTTVNAIPGMAGRPLPIRAAPTAPSPSDGPTPEPEPEPETVDTTAPGTAIGSRDLVRTRDRTPTFQFASDEVNVRFECAIDGGLDVPCSSPFTASRLGFGEHTFSVRAIDAVGNVDASAASDSFKVVKKRRR
jgi:hypothetical protein